MLWIKCGRPLQSFAAPSYLTELWLTQRQAINWCSVLFLELNAVWVLFVFFCFALTYSKARNCQIPPLRLNTWKSQCQGSPQKGKPNFLLAEQAYPQSEGVIAGRAKLGYMQQHGASLRAACPCMFSEPGFLQTPFELHAVANCAVYWYSNWLRESSWSCVQATRRSIGVLVWGFGGAIPVGVQTLSCRDLGTAPAFAANSKALDPCQDFWFATLYCAFTQVFLARNLTPWGIK